jgi:hypothetical protein
MEASVQATEEEMSYRVTGRHPNIKIKNVSIADVF